LKTVIFPNTWFDFVEIEDGFIWANTSKDAKGAGLFELYKRDRLSYLLLERLYSSPVFRFHLVLDKIMQTLCSRNKG